MTKKTFRPFRIEDLTGWINKKDYSTEIENKQAVNIENFNFKGNKLVSEKWFEDSWNIPQLKIGWMKIDSWDIWTVSDGNILKNWASLPKWQWISITINSKNFKNWYEYYIIIDWVEYKVREQTITDALTSLYNQLDWNIYDRFLQDDLLVIKKISGWDVTYSQPNIPSLIIYNTDTVASYVYWKTYRYSYKIGTTTYNWEYKMSRVWMNAWQVDIEMITQMASELPPELEAEVVFLDNAKNIVKVYENSAGIKIKTSEAFTPIITVANLYRIRWYSDASWGQVDSYLNTTQLSLDWNLIKADMCYELMFWPWSWWYTFTNDTFIIDWISITLDWLMYATQNEDNVFSPIVNALNTNWNYYTYIRIDRKSLIVARKDWKEIPEPTFNWVWIIWTYSDTQPWYRFSYSNWRIISSSSERLQRDEFTRRNRIIEEINAIPWYNAKEWFEVNSKLWIYVWKDDYSTIVCENFDLDFSSILHFSKNDIWEFNFQFASADIRWTKIEWTDYVVKPLRYNSTLNKWRTNITVWNQWTLFIDKDLGWASYYYDWIYTTVWNSSIWLPTVWTIYNGKVILWWYKWNDNIIFSKTSSPIFPLNFLNFTDYSSGWQSVSGWDKWIITWMIAGAGEKWLYIFKDNSVWYTNSEKDIPWTAFNLIFRKITSNWALNQNVITEVEQEIFYLDWKTREVRRLWYEQNLTTLRDVGISREISDMFNNLPEDQPLATSSFSYPNYQLSLSSWQSDTVEYNNGNIYHLNDKHFIYNVDNKSWTTRTWIDNMIVSNNWYFASADWKVYKDFKLNWTEDWLFESKEYSFWDDVMLKKFWRLEIVGKIIPDAWKEKTITVEIWIDGEKSDELSYTKTEESLIREKIFIYDIWHTIQFKFKHSWFGSVEIYDTQIYYKPTTIQY